MPDFDHVLRARRSVRGYLPEPLTRSEIEEIFALSSTAPSNCNIQPWHVHIASGAKLRQIGARMIEASRAEVEPNPDVVMDTRYKGVYRERQIGAAVALYSAMGIARDDMAGRFDAHLRNLDAFGAPHAAFFFLPEGFGKREATDLGGFVQTVMLAITSRGYASCAQGALSLYPEIVREELGLARGPQLLLGLAFGREDPSHPANTARTTRAGLGEILAFHD